SHRVRAQPDEEPQPSRGRVPPHLVGAPLKAAVLGGGSSLRFLRQITQQGPEFFRDVGAEHEAKEPERPLHLDPLTHTRSRAVRLDAAVEAKRRARYDAGLELESIAR